MGLDLFFRILTQREPVDADLVSPSRENYFQQFGFSEDSVHLDLSTLEKTYRRLTLENHPDRNAGDLSCEKKMAWINDGYRTLKDLKLRAAYLAKLHQVDLSKTPVPIVWAEEWFELQELKMENSSAFENALQEFQKKLKLHIENLKDNIRLIDSVSKRKEEFRKLLGEWNYCASLLENTTMGRATP